LCLCQACEMGEGSKSGSKKRKMTPKKPPPTCSCCGHEGHNVKTCLFFFGEHEVEPGVMVPRKTAEHFGEAKLHALRSRFELMIGMWDNFNPLVFEQLKDDADGLPNWNVRNDGGRLTTTESDIRVWLLANQLALKAKSDAMGV